MYTKFVHRINIYNVLMLAIKKVSFEIPLGMSLVKTGNKRSTMTNNVSKEILWKGFSIDLLLRMKNELVNILNYLMFYHTNVNIT